MDLQRNERPAAFTLIELLVVIAIIAILADGRIDGASADVHAMFPF